MSILEDWKLAADVAQVFASVVVGIALVYTISTFYRAKRADQMKLTEGVFKDLRAMQKELHTDNETQVFDYEDWESRFFNTLEWFSFLVNANEVTIKLAKGFFEDSIIEWHDELLSDKAKQNPKKYRELKKLYKRLKKQSISDKMRNFFIRKNE